MMSQPYTAIAAPGARRDMRAETLPLIRQNRSLAALWQAWHTQMDATGGAVPRKASLRMQAVKGILPVLVISERVAPDLIRIRLAGSLADEILGGGLTGMNTLDLSPAEQRAAIQRVYANIASVPCGFYISETLHLAGGKVSHLDALVLPLAGAGGDDVRFFVGVYHFGRHGYELGHGPAAKIEHRQIEQFGYLDIGFGLPA